jgi:predicted RND superfamily exporter protein
VRTFWSKLAVQLGKRAGLVSIVGLIITLVLGAGIPKLQFATGQDSYLNKSDQVAKDNVSYQKLFGGQIVLVLFTMEPGHNVSELTSPANQKAIRAAQKEIEAKPEVKAVLSPLDTLDFSANLLTHTVADPSKPAPKFDLATASTSIAGATTTAAQAAETPGSKGQKARAADFAQTAERLGPFTDQPAATPPVDNHGKRTLTNPQWVDVLLKDNTGQIRKPLRSSFFDDRHAQMIVRLKGNADVVTEGKGADAVKAAWADKKIEGGSTLVTGAPFILQDINNYLRGGILSLGAIAIAIMVLILLVFFDVRWRLLPLAVVLVGVIWAFGLAGYLGIPLSIVTIAGLPVMLGVGIDYAIQMHARVEEEVVIDRATHPIQETARNLCPALLVVTFDALFAFFALRFAKVPMIRSFALLLCIGIAVICLCSIILPLATLGIREFRSPTTGRDFREGRLGTFVVWLGSISAKAAPVLMVVSILIFAGGILTEGRLTLQTDPIQWVNQSSQNRKDVATLEDRTGASSELGIYVTAGSEKGLFSDKTMNWLEGFSQESLQRYPDKLLVGSSVLSPLADLTDLGCKSPKNAGTDDASALVRCATDRNAGKAASSAKGPKNFVPSGALVKASYEAAPQQVKAFTVSEAAKGSGAQNALNILFITKPGSLQTRSVMIDDMRTRLAAGASNTPPARIDATPSGLAVVGVGLLKNLESNRVQLTYLSIGLVFLFLAARLRSLTRSLLSLVPVIIAVGLSSLVAFAFSLKLSPMTAVGGPLVIAICTEFTSLILLRFIEERGRGLSPQAAADVTAARTGRAFIVSGMTAVTGVAVIATSSLPLLRDFGTIVAMNVVIALVSALVVLPPIMVWAEGRGWVTKGLVPPEQLGNKTRDEADTATADLGGAGPNVAGSVAPA